MLQVYATGSSVHVSNVGPNPGTVQPSENISDLWRSSRKLNSNKENENTCIQNTCMSVVRDFTSALSEVEFNDSHSHMNIDLNIPDDFDDDDMFAKFSEEIEMDLEGMESII